MALYLIDDIEARQLPDYLSLYYRDRGEPVIIIRRYALNLLLVMVGIQRTYIRMYRIDLRYMRDQVYTVPFHSIRTARDFFDFPTNLQNRHKSRKNYWRGQRKLGVTRDVRIE